jgi:hypothetical protein
MSNKTFQISLYSPSGLNRIFQGTAWALATDHFTTVEWKPDENWVLTGLYKAFGSDLGSYNIDTFPTPVLKRRIEQSTEWMRQEYVRRSASGQPGVAQFLKELESRRTAALRSLSQKFDKVTGSNRDLARKLSHDIMVAQGVKATAGICLAVGGLGGLLGALGVTGTALTAGQTVVASGVAAAYSTAPAITQIISTSQIPSSPMDVVGYLLVPLEYLLGVRGDGLELNFEQDKAFWASSLEFTKRELAKMDEQVRRGLGLSAEQLSRRTQLQNQLQPSAARGGAASAGGKFINIARFSFAAWAVRNEIKDYLDQIKAMNQ